jgi:hypothetical protein
MLTPQMAAGQAFQFVVNQRHDSAKRLRIPVVSTALQIRDLHPDYDTPRWRDVGMLFLGYGGSGSSDVSDHEPVARLLAQVDLECHNVYTTLIQGEIDESDSAEVG